MRDRYGNDAYEVVAEIAEVLLSSLEMCEVESTVVFRLLRGNGNGNGNGAKVFRLRSRSGYPLPFNIRKELLVLVYCSSMYFC